MQFNKAIYEKYGIKVTDGAIHDNRPADQLEIEVSFHNTVKHKQINATTVKSLEEAVEKYPKSEALKNYLYIAYAKIGKKEEALDCLHRTIKLHPNYPFGIINLVNYYISKNDLENARRLLKEPYDVRNVVKDEYINYSVFINYYQTVVRLAVAKSDRKVAEKYHRLMFDYDPKDETVKELASLVVGVRMSSMQKRMQAPSVRAVEATEKRILGWDKTDKQPVFIHSEVLQLFEIDTAEMPKTLIDRLLALPRETFIQDLENILADTIQRRDKHLSQTEWNGETQSFPLHALYFLAELRAYDSLTTILNLLRQDQAFLDYWFSELLHELFYPSLYILGNTQLSVLQDFVTENNNYCWARNLATNVAAQTALRQPERRNEVVTWFRNVIQIHLDQADNNAIIDNIVLSDLVAHVLDFSGIELEDQIVALFEKGWITEGVCGDLEEVLEKLHKPSFAQGRVNALPASIYEMYNNKYSDVVENLEAKVHIDAYLDRLTEDPYDAFLTKNGWGNLLENVENNKYEDEDYGYRSPQETVKRVEPKVGRNDPCPCGSGKKYKKCHGA